MLDVKYKVYCFAGDIARANGGQCNGCLVATREGTTGFLFANAGKPTGTQLDTVGQQYSWVCFVVIGYVYLSGMYLPFLVHLYHGVCFSELQINLHRTTQKKHLDVRS